jgi:uncharacterized protein YecE (DUF72 family)
MKAGKDRSTETLCEDVVRAGMLRRVLQYLYNGEPLFRTVGNDSTFYRPPTANQLKNDLNQIPEDFQMCFKVWKSSRSHLL